MTRLPCHVRLRTVIDLLGGETSRMVKRSNEDDTTFIFTRTIQICQREMEQQTNTNTLNANTVKCYGSLFFIINFHLNKFKFVLKEISIL